MKIKKRTREFYETLAQEFPFPDSAKQPKCETCAHETGDHKTLESDYAPCAVAGCSCEDFQFRSLCVKCSAEITTADREAGRCTQCGKRLK